MSHIKSIEIKNFKSIAYQKIEGCKRINVFVGPPNVGKSNILEAIGLYSFTQVYEKESFSLESICRYSHLSDLNFNKDITNTVAIGINKTYELNLGKNSKDFQLSIRSANKRNLNVFNIVLHFDIGKQFLEIPQKEEDKDQVIYKIKYYSFDKNAKYNEIKSSSLSIPNGDNLLDILQGNSELRKEYTELLKDYGLRLNISENEIAVAKEISDGTYVSFRNNVVSDTLRRLFFYKAAIVTNNNSVLLFEEPEAHMFPPYITKFTSNVMYDVNNNQFFITTHSPFVLNDFMEQLKPEDLAIYLVSYKNETGETIINKMSDEDMHEAAQFGYDFFLNLDNFIPKS